MKCMHKIFLSLLCLSAFSSNAMAAAHRGGAELLNAKAYSVNSSASMFQTTSYYDYEGVEQEMADGDEYQMINVDFSVSYGLSRNLEVTGMGRFRSVTSTANNVSASNSGPESLGVEIKYGFPQMEKSRWAIGAHYRQTLYSNASYDATVQVPTEEIILGDAGSEYGVDVYYTYVGNPFKIDAKFGYSSPANNLSAELNYKLEGMYTFSKLGLFAGVEGIYSLKKDEFGDTPLLKPPQSVGASRLFHSINREVIAPYVGANYAFSKFIIGVRGQTIVKGVSTDRGNAGMLTVGWNSDGVTAESVKIDAFKEYHVDGSVLKVSARGNFIRIDQGLSTDVEKGMKFDIYQTDYFGGNVLVASGVAYDVGADWSVIKLLKKYKEIEIKPGFAARGY